MIPAFDHFFIGDVLDMHNHQLKVDISKTTPKPSQFSNKFFFKKKKSKDPRRHGKSCFKNLNWGSVLNSCQTNIPNSNSVGFLLWGGAWFQQNACSGKPEHCWNLAEPCCFLAGPCWNLAATSRNLAGTLPALLEPCWNLAGPCWNLVGILLECRWCCWSPCWSLAGTLLEIRWNLPQKQTLLQVEPSWNLGGAWWSLAGIRWGLEPGWNHVAGSPC